MGSRGKHPVGEWVAHAVSRLSPDSLMYATEVEEFYYNDTDDVVLEGEPIGVDVEIGDGVDLILFSNIYWNPQY